jgi:hypothetical protein
MTEPRRGLLTVLLGALAAFELVALLLVVQMRLGHDPALGTATAATPPARRVLVHKIEQRRIVVRVLPSGEDDGGGGRAVIVTQPATGGSAPAPVTSAPAAPLTTRAS